MFYSNSSLIKGGFSEESTEIDFTPIKIPCVLCVRYTLKKNYNSIYALSKHLYGNHKNEVSKDDIKNIICIIRLIVKAGGLKA